MIERPSSSLPIESVLPQILETLQRQMNAVLVAPPGAGKTTRVPLALLDAPWASGRRIVVLEPRRLAAQAAAEWMARSLGESVGETVGLRVRFGSRVSSRTRIEIVTEGVFTRLILDDPSLEGIAAVLFDEFHERSLDADVALALALDAQGGLRDDLRLLIMSATLDVARVAGLLGGAPVIESAGRMFPVETRYLGRDPRARIEDQVASAIVQALRGEKGSILAFLPGAGEIRRTETLLRERIASDAVDIVPLYGALDRGLQERAIALVLGGRRKVVLATAIAETSLTIEGVRIVVDSGLARVPRYEPDVGMTRLETVRVSRAAADQRRGRAGRTETGVCLRLWDEPQTASLEAFARPEILAADLSGLVLDLAYWGVTDPSGLAFMDQPPAAAWKQAQKLLRDLGALDSDGRITDEGRRLRRLPLPPRLARMVLEAAALGSAELASQMAMLVSERGLGGDDIDLSHRLEVFSRDRSARAEQARATAARWARAATREARSRETSATSEDALSIGRLLALAYPERIAKNRADGAFLLANGRGAVVDVASPLARAPFLAVAELTGTAARARVVLAAPLSLAEIESECADRIKVEEDVSFDPESMRLRARSRRRLGALTLSDATRTVEPNNATARILADGLVRLGLEQLPWSNNLRQWRERVAFMRRMEGEPWPDLSDAALSATVSDWLVPALAGKSGLSDLSPDEFAAALQNLLPWSMRRRLETAAPTHFDAPSGSRIPIAYDDPEGPKLSIRVQEVFGLSRHPAVADGQAPLVIELLSPAHRPVQVTRDLPGFWRGSYAAVRTEMRGRYPRHPWPDDPVAAPATRRAKPRGT